MLIVDVEFPSGFTGPVPVIDEFATTGAPAINEIGDPDLTTGTVI
jgi:hypothetical protein